MLHPLSIDAGFDDSFSGILAGVAARRGGLYQSRDVSAVRQRMDDVFLPHRMQPRDASQPFECLHARLPFSCFSLEMVRYNQEVVVETPPFENFYGFQLTLAGECEVGQASRSYTMNAQRLFAVRPQHSFRQRLLPGYVQLMIRVEREALERSLWSQIGVQRQRLIDFTGEPVMLDAEAANIACAINALVGELAAPGNRLANPVVRRGIEESFLATLLAYVPNSHQLDYVRSDVRALPYYVRRAQHYLAEHFDEDISLDDLVSVCGVSRRSLHGGFRDHLGTTPMAYLKTLRLRAAHEALRAAARTGRSVTDIALACGFSHLSKFARDYQLMFGQTPSTTLRGGH